MSAYSIRIYDTEIMFRVESSNGAPLRAVLRWHSEDPFAVVAFMSTKRGSATWEFALDLLVDALASPNEAVGLGDVRVQVTSDGELWLWLSSPTGSAVLTCEARRVTEFVHAVDSLMDSPSVTAGEQLDWFLDETRGEIQW